MIKAIFRQGVYIGMFLIMFGLLGCVKTKDNTEPKCAMCTTTATVYFDIPKEGYPKVYSDSIKRCDLSIEKFERINQVDTPPMEEKIDTLTMFTKVQTCCKWIN
jgi:hypothetical protein